MDTKAIRERIDNFLETVTPEEVAANFGVTEEQKLENYKALIEEIKKTHAREIKIFEAYVEDLNKEVQSLQRQVSILTEYNDVLLSSLKKDCLKMALEHFDGFLEDRAIGVAEKFVEFITKPKEN